MFDMGFLELLMIGIIALIILGPERLPKAARVVGLWIGKAKHGFESMKSEIDRELKLKELQQQIAEQKAKLEEDIDISSDISSFKDELKDSANSIQKETSSLGTSYVEEQSDSKAEEVSDKVESKGN